MRAQQLVFRPRHRDQQSSFTRFAEPPASQPLEHLIISVRAHEVAVF
jgi:hypothetical protein